MLKVNRDSLRIFGLCGVVLLGACAAPANVVEGGFLRPNANLVVEGVPPIPASLARAVEKYTDFRGHNFVAWHPVKREMVVAHRKAGANTMQLFRLASPLGELEALTEGPDPVSEASYEPITGKYLVFERSSGGNEVTQLYRLDLETRQVTLLTNPDERHDHLGWLHHRALAIVSSVPIDRTARGGTRASINTTLWLLDPENPAQKKKLVELPGPGWLGGSVSGDDRKLALIRYLSANESQIWVLDLASGERQQLLPAAGGKEKATYYPGPFRKDGSGLFVVSDRASEFREMMLYDFAKQSFTRITENIPWDVSGGTATEDDRLFALQTNEDGRDVLRLFDGATLKERPMPRLPEGNIGTTRFHKRLPELLFSLNSARGPSEIHSVDPESGKVTQWTRAYAPQGIDLASFSEQKVVRWPSFDGRQISGLLSLPPKRFAGKRPVLILIHGGPEGQATIGFLARYQYYIQELGIALIQPNVRGSTGFGKTFLALDNGRLREDSLKDIGALLDWVATQPDLDASRVLVAGGSYGGDMSLAVATHYADRIAGAIDVVGISHFVTFLESTESYRRDLRRVEYGDERDPEMRAFLDRISPLANAHKIKKPLFVVQGKNDPRVPYTEAEQIVAKARANGTPVWYLRADNEGHGFARKENADFQLYSTILFFEQTILR
ncbi:prolyl oligopeptidase [Burkholderiales bacterium]|nr:prolyl oligopeptidase [Burkholderiales bacterium]